MTDRVQPPSEPTAASHQLSPADYDEQWSRLDDFIRYNPGARHRRRLLLRALRAQRFEGGSVVDVGCGPGATVEFLSRAIPRAHFTGIDLSPLAIRACEGRLPQFDWIVNDVTERPLDHEFDVVICSEVLEHLEQPAKTVQHLASMTRRGGIVVITVPSGKIFATERAVGHLRHPTIAELTTWVDRAGLGVVALTRWGWPAYSLLKRAANLSPEATIERFGSGRYSRTARALNHLAYAACGIGSLPSSPFGPQTVLTAMKKTGEE
jgi:SAM-dependent methyltransferase